MNDKWVTWRRRRIPARGRARRLSAFGERVRFLASSVLARRQHLVHAHYHETAVKRLKHSLHRNIAMRSERSAYCTLAIRFRTAANTITQTLDVKSIRRPVVPPFNYSNIRRSATGCRSHPKCRPCRIVSEARWRRRCFRAKRMKAKTRRIRRRL